MVYRPYHVGDTEMTREQKDLVIIKSRPGSPGVGEIGENGIQPWQTDPDLAAMATSPV